MDVNEGIFSPFSLRGVSLPNRIVMSPMCQYSATDGIVAPWHVTHYASRAVGGTGMVMSEAVAVTPEGRISYADLGVWEERQIAGLRTLTEAIRAHGAVAAVQLAHAGRKAGSLPPWLEGEPPKGYPRWQPVGATDQAFSKHHHAPHAMSISEVEGVVEAFVRAARRSLEAGFQVVEIHAAHGYLLHQFLSPLVNTRTDRYGGDQEGRFRLLVEIAQRIRREVGEDVPVIVRLSVSDWHPEGLSVDDSVALSKVLYGEGVDLIDCSSGGIAPEITIPIGAGYQVAFADQIRRQVGVPTGAVGMITAPYQADQIVRSGQADLVFLGRVLLRDPYWVQRAAMELGREAVPPPQYRRAW